ncbi:Ca2+-binding RTX toxin-like protein [Pararhizobium capsulatum DSM 1112]|uniref:Ca2+-binding RTX toxin-like protein n=1 Tax=Pararhizobium capsulatum DSM 1112 TaxID=1121113 RepID=A0ABU0C1F9_9HYPH|nr:Ca2+-binding RTX toxin-like protein [Pararhizobium capsulatum DSM 1112]
MNHVSQLFEDDVVTSPSINTGDAKGDTYVSIENLSGSNFNDTLYGSAAANAISGAEGDSFSSLNGFVQSRSGIETSRLGSCRTGLDKNLSMRVFHLAAGRIYVPCPLENASNRNRSILRPEGFGGLS